MEENYKEVKNMQNVKKITSHGSVSIPVAMRRSLGLGKKDALDVTVDDEGRIILTPHVPRCFACQSEKNITTMSGTTICETCCRKALDMIGRDK
jgi:transcriptional pleiotropic regulator of transition state genes